MPLMVSVLSVPSWNQRPPGLKSVLAKVIPHWCICWGLYRPQLHWGFNTSWYQSDIIINPFYCKPPASWKVKVFFCGANVLRKFHILQKILSWKNTKGTICFSFNEWFRLGWTNKNYWCVFHQQEPTTNPFPTTEANPEDQLPHASRHEIDPHLHLELVLCVIPIIYKLVSPILQT